MRRVLVRTLPSPVFPTSTPTVVEARFVEALAINKLVSAVRRRHCPAVTDVYQPLQPSLICLSARISRRGTPAVITAKSDRPHSYIFIKNTTASRWSSVDGRDLSDCISNRQDTSSQLLLLVCFLLASSLEERRMMQKYDAVGYWIWSVAIFRQSLKPLSQPQTSTIFIQLGIEIA